MVGSTSLPPRGARQRRDLVQSSGPPRGVFSLRSRREKEGKQGRLCPRIGAAGQERTSHNG